MLMVSLIDTQANVCAHLSAMSFSRSCDEAAGRIANMEFVFVGVAVAIRRLLLLLL